MVIRYNTDGSLDASFDGDGIATTKVGLWPTAWSVAIQPDNKIIVGGFTWWGDGTFANDHFALARYNPDGSLDTTFNGDGKVITRICDHTFCNDDLQSIALQPDGKIIAVGGSFSLGSSPQFIALRHGTDGSLDGNFHLGGSSAGAQTAGGYFTSATIQLDGKILLAGTGPLPLIRLNSNGSFDTTFDFDGTVSTGLDGSYVAIQSSNRIIVAGSRNNGSNSDYKIIRFNSDGSLDTTFGGGDGESTVDFGGTNDYVWATALDRFGRAVVVGRIWAGNTFPA